MLVQNMASLTISTMALFTMGNIKCFKFHETFKYHIFRKLTKSRRLVIGGYPTPTHGVNRYLFAQPEFSPTAIKIKQPSSILRHPTMPPYRRKKFFFKMTYKNYFQ